MDVLIFIGSFLLGLICFYFCAKNKFKATKEKDYETQQFNEELQEKLKELKRKYDILIQDTTEARYQLHSLENQKKLLSDTIEDNYNTIQKLAEQYKESTIQAKQNAELFEKEVMDKAKLEIDIAMEELGKQYQIYEQECQKEYEQVLADLSKTSIDYQKEIDKLKVEFKEQKAKVDAAVEANMRAAELEQKASFYSLNISESNLNEIKKIREIIPYLKNSEILNKVIWKTYYEKPTTDLIGRVVGKNNICGIYKITNKVNGMCYVGQTKNFSDRFRQHIKRGLGAEAATQNKLYPAMKEFGVENFTFEIIENCDSSELNEREQFWQEYFSAKTFGYSIK